jgi:hypothetical protein
MLRVSSTCLVVLDRTWRRTKPTRYSLNRDVLGT